MRIMDDRSPPPFLSSKSAETEHQANEWPSVRPPPPALQENQIDKLKNNPVILGILIGIVIGILLTNMRPLIINPTK